MPSQGSEDPHLPGPINIYFSSSSISFLRLLSNSCAAARPGVVDVLVQRLAPKNVKCMAFGAQGDVAKFYFYAVEVQTQSVLLVELQVSKSSGQAQATVKGPNPNTIPPFSALLKQALAMP